MTGEITSHNVLYTDPVLQYVDWAVSAGFGILDVNIPSYPHGADESMGFKPKISEADLNEQAKNLLCYLWDNYLEGYRSHTIVLMGVGDAYLGVKQLLTSRGECFSSI